MSDLSYPEGGDHKATQLPYVTNTCNQDFPLRMGGEVVTCLAAGSLNVGDVVYLSAVDTVNKSNTVTNYAGFFGVVVGGYLTNFQIIQADANIGTLPAATTGQNVKVQTSGVVKVISDATLATFNTRITAGATTAGRVGTVNGAAGNYIGYTLDAAATAGLPIRIFITRT